MGKGKVKKARGQKRKRLDAYIGNRMRERGLEQKISREVLAKTLGISFQQDQKYETGENRVSAARLLEICKALQLPLASMFERDPIA